MNEPISEEAIETDLCIHIFSVSAALVGVCLTVIGLFRVSMNMKSVATLGDDLLAVDALFFLCSCILSYAALRTRLRALRRRIERVADWVFLCGLLLMVVICGLITYAFV